MREMRRGFVAANISLTKFPSHWGSFKQPSKFHYGIDHRSFGQAGTDCSSIAFNSVVDHVPSPRCAYQRAVGKEKTTLTQSNSQRDKSSTPRLINSIPNAVKLPFYPLCLPVLAMWQRNQPAYCPGSSFCRQPSLSKR